MIQDVGAYCVKGSGWDDLVNQCTRAQCVVVYPKGSPRTDSSFGRKY
jgi:hypothetical protein